MGIADLDNINIHQEDLSLWTAFAYEVGGVWDMREKPFWRAFAPPQKTTHSGVCNQNTWISFVDCSTGSDWWDNMWTQHRKRQLSGRLAGCFISLSLSAWERDDVRNVAYSAASNKGTQLIFCWCTFLFSVSCGGLVFNVEVLSLVGQLSIRLLIL